MDLAFYIYSFLQKQGKSIDVPHFGVFSIAKTSAQLDKSASKILPPKEGIYFERKESNTNQLAEFISKKTRKPLLEVQNLLEEETQKWLKELNDNQLLEIKDIGKISIGENTEWTFQPADNTNSICYFGLEEINISECTRPQQKGQNKSFFWLFIFALIISAGGFLGFYYQDYIIEFLYSFNLYEEIELFFQNLKSYFE